MEDILKFHKSFSPFNVRKSSIIRPIENTIIRYFHTKKKKKKKKR